MGRSRKCHYVVMPSDKKFSSFEWLVKEYGKPTAENLSKWRDDYNKSISPGGVNEHIGINGWMQCRLSIYDQFKNETVATYSAPMFEVIP